ncbi:hypothetical protein ACFX19_034387 [Malus domestica]
MGHVAKVLAIGFPKGPGSSQKEAQCEEENVLCVVDGNEVMRFHCLGPGVRVYESCSCVWGFHGGKGKAIYTYSGVAHEGTGVGGAGKDGDTSLLVHCGSDFEVDEADAGLSGWPEEAWSGE